MFKRILCFVLAAGMLVIPAAADQSGPISCFSFDKTIEDSVSAAKSSTSNEPVYIKGVSNEALDIKGENRFLKLSDFAGSLNGAPAITVSGSFKNYDLPAQNPKQYFIAKLIIDGGTTGGFNLYIENNNLVLESRSRPGESMQSIKTPFTDTKNWHSFAATADYANKKLILCLDGEINSSSKAFAENAFLLGNPSNPDFTIGGAGSSYFNGAVDEFKIFNTPLSEEELIALTEKSADSSKNPYIVGAWDFDSVLSADTLGREFEFDVSDYFIPEGKDGGGLSLSGKEKPLSLGKDIAQAIKKQSAVTVSLWFLNNDIGDYSLFKTYNASRAGFEIGMDKDGLFVFVKSAPTDTGVSLHVPFSDTGNWHNVTAAADFAADEITLYLDGAYAASLENAGLENRKYLTANINNDDYLGGFNKTTMFNGRIDNFAVFTKPLNEDEIKSLYEDKLSDIRISAVSLKKVSFTDIEGHKYEEEILKASSYGYLSYGKDRFCPELNVTRSELLTALSAVLGIKETAYKNTVRDISAGSFAKIFAGALEAGLIDLKLLSEQEFKPSSAATLYDAYLLQKRAYEIRGQNDGELPAPDREKYLTRGELAKLITDLM